MAEKTSLADISLREATVIAPLVKVVGDKVIAVLALARFLRLPLIIVFVIVSVSVIFEILGALSDSVVGKKRSGFIFDTASTMEIVMTDYLRGFRAQSRRSSYS